MIHLSADRLWYLLRYEPQTGAFTWRVNRYVVKAGDVAGCQNPRGYRWITIDGKSYSANCLAWLYMTGQWPEGAVDHRDCDSANDRWDNFRIATTSQNSANRRTHSNNTSGFKGVTYRKDTRKWMARIRVNYHFYNLGVFSTPEDAHAAYVAAAREHFGEFARAA